MVYILGITHRSEHDHSAALIKNGKIIAAAEEERFARIKHCGFFPHQSIKFCLDFAGITINDVDYVAYTGIPDKYYKQYKNKLTPIKEKNMFYIPHHLAHASSSFRLSGMNYSNVLTVDYGGDVETLAFFEGLRNRIIRKWHLPFMSSYNKDYKCREFLQSIGGVYSFISTILGFGNAFGEGKTMGLAPYGRPIVDFSNILDITSRKKFVINSSISTLYSKFGKYQRKPNEPIRNIHKNLASSLQKALEKSILNLTKDIFETTEIKNLCLAGGVALNCKMNGTLWEQGYINKIFIQPAANDAGCSLGAAFEAYAQLGYRSKCSLNDTYLGPEFHNEEIEEQIKREGLLYEYYDDIEGVAAELLVKSKIIGWFQGRMEWGPRALGNRSILADPRKKENYYKVNRIKGREIWRPLAPSIIEESFEEYFKNPGSSPFMLLTFEVKEDKIKEIPAVVHVDQTTRPQTVTKENNLLYHRLIKNFEELSSTPLVLNTSFNLQNEPIVCNPSDAIKSFKRSNLDYLIMGNFLVKKSTI